MAETSARMRLHVGIFGRRNVGKSSVFNRLARHKAAIVSSEPGTTTDPVKKAMEHHFLGPMMLIDTAGLDDVGDLGKKRVEKTLKTAGRVDMGLLVATTGGWGKYEENLALLLKERNIPVIIVFNKVDQSPPNDVEIEAVKRLGLPWVQLSALTGKGMNELYDRISNTLPNYWLESRPIIRDLYPAGGTAVLAVEPGYNLPAGRIYNPHNRIIRDALDNDARCAVVKGNRLKAFTGRLSSPVHLVVADSSVTEQAMEHFSDEVPVIPTSVIMARHRGELLDFALGAVSILDLDEGAPVLMADLSVSLWKESDRRLESVVQWIGRYTGRSFKYTFAGRREIPEEPGRFSLTVLSGEESLTVKKTIEKIEASRRNGIAVTNPDFIAGLFVPACLRTIKPFADRYIQLQEIINETIGRCRDMRHTEK